ncbi:carbohydrate deacetylase [Georgenia deserti]|uniref:Carbohydrate deacetylase n=1 Tax=Georgenia deserti TaxID=2093781 RepID=A0ABW4L2Y7_9MICO
MRKLVVTADDLGLDPATNAEITDLARRERVTATTLMPVAPGARDAVRRVTAAGLAPPRLHVTLTSARELPPWRPVAADVGSLTEADGVFPVTPRRVAALGEAADVARELAAQWRWMRTGGLPPSGLDSHSGVLYQHTGLGAALRFCAEHSLAFRLPARLQPVVRTTWRGRLRRRYDEAVARARDLGVRLPETVLTPWLPGRLLLSYDQLRAHVLAQVRAVPEGVSELIMHPAAPSTARTLAPAEGRKRVWELRLLRDPTFLAELRRERIALAPSW